MLIIYTYEKCDRCRAATKWLRARGMAFEERPIRERPPAPGELRVMLAARGGDPRRICNTSGRDYRELKLGERIGAMAEAEVIALLAANGNLVKRPFLLGNGVALAGFDEKVWSDTFSR